MENKSYRLKAESRQWPTKKAGDMIELPPRAAQYLVRAGVLEEEPGGAAEAPPAARRRKTEG